MPHMKLHTGDLESPIDSLEKYFGKGGSSIIQAAFAHSYFIHPDAVRAKTPYYPARARRSREHYPGLDRGSETTWPGDGRLVRVGDNYRAQLAWERYTGRKLLRGIGYSVRHIWGNPWDPDFFTAGWNLCYMPFWAGMLTEDQQPHEKLQRAIQQASWDLFFHSNPVCQPPDLVNNPGMDLRSLLADQPILLLGQETPATTPQIGGTSPNLWDVAGDISERVREIRHARHQSWSNIRKAMQALQGLHHEPFGTPNVENSAKSCVRRILSETSLGIAQLEALLDEQGW